MSPARFPGFTSRKTSVVVISYNEGRNLRSTVASLHETLPRDGEIVVVDDGSTDGSADFLKHGRPGIHMARPRHRLGVARARNWGASLARGDYVIFTDAHVSFRPGWQRPMVELLADPRIGAVAPAIYDQDRPDRTGFGLRVTGPDLEVEWLDRQGDKPYPVPLLPGGCLAMRRDTFEAIGGFDEGLLRWGVEDMELSLRLWLLGYELLLVPKVSVGHQFRNLKSYTIHWKTVLHNRLRMAFLHLNARRLVRVVQAYQDCQVFASSLGLLLDSDIAARRADLRSRRVRDDDWFFDKFNMKW